MTIPAVSKMIPLFINFLAALAPSIWVILAGVAGVSVGAFGTYRFSQKKAKSPVAARQRRHAARKPRISRLK